MAGPPHSSDKAVRAGTLPFTVGLFRLCVLSGQPSACLAHTRNACERKKEGHKRGRLYVDEGRAGVHTSAVRLGLAGERESRGERNQHGQFQAERLDFVLRTKRSHGRVLG